MSAATYYTTIGSIMMTIWLTPGLDDLFKGLVIFIVVITAVLVTAIFNIGFLRDWIVRTLVADVIRELVIHPELRKIFELAGGFKIQRRVMRALKSKKLRNEKKKS